MGLRQNHPAADLFPMMSDDRYAELRDSIRANGQHSPIVLFTDGSILDGRNRYRACIELGIEPHFETYDGDPFEFAWDLNGQRRDLTIQQRAQIFVIALQESPVWKEKLAAIAAEANAKRSEASIGNQSAAKNGGASTCGPTVSEPAKRDSAKKNKTKASTAKGKASGTSQTAIEKAENLLREAPDLAHQVAMGEIKATQAFRQLRKAKIANRVEPFPDGKFRVIYADPPWQYSDTREGLGAGDSASGGVDRASTAAKDHYPTMSKADLKALDVKSLADEDAVLFCWATYPLLPDQLEVISAWGFKYKTAFIWDKGRGSFGHYHDCCAEVLFVCTRGSCTPDSKKKEKQIQKFKAGRHSAKPDEFRAMIDRMYPHGPRVELFRRGDVPAGWQTWGNEAAQPVAEAAE